MSQITLKFDGDDKDAAAAIDRLNKQMAKLSEENKRLKDSSKAATDQTKDGFDAAITGAAGAVAGLVAVGAIVDRVRQAYEQWNQETQRLGKTHADMANELAKSLSLSGDLANATKIRQSLETTPGATYAEASAAFKGVSTAEPSMALEKRLSIAREAASLGVAGFDTEKLGAGAAGVADIDARISAGDAVDMAALLRAKAGTNYDKIEADGAVRAIKQIVGSGAADASAGFALAVEASGENLPKGAMPQLAEALTKTFENKGKHLTDDQRLQNEFSKLSAPERFRELTQGTKYTRAVLGDSIGPAMGLIDRDRMEANRREFAAEQIEGVDYRRDVLGMMSGDPVLAAGAQAHGYTVELEDAQRYRAERAAQAERAKAFVQLRMEKTGQAGPINNAVTGLGDWMLGMQNAEPMSYVESSVGYIGKGAIDEFKRNESASGATAHLEELRKQTQALQNLNRTQRTKSNPNVHSEGQ